MWFARVPAIIEVLLGCSTYQLGVNILLGPPYNLMQIHPTYPHPVLQITLLACLEQSDDPQYDSNVHTASLLFSEADGFSS